MAVERLSQSALQVWITYYENLIAGVATSANNHPLLKRLIATNLDHAEGCIRYKVSLFFMFDLVLFTGIQEG